MQTKLGLQIESADPTSIFQLQERIGKGAYASVYKGTKEPPVFLSICIPIVVFFVCLFLKRN